MLSSAAQLALVLAVAPGVLGESGPRPPDVNPLPEAGAGRRQLDIARDLTWGGASLTGFGLAAAGMATWGVVVESKYGRLADDACPPETGAFDSCDLYLGQQQRGRAAMIGFGIGAAVLLHAGVAMLITGARYRRWGEDLQWRARLTSGGVQLKF